MRMDGPRFVEEVPEVEIVDGLVRTRLGNCQWYWKPSTYRAYIELSRRELASFDRAARKVVPFKSAG